MPRLQHHTRLYDQPCLEEQSCTWQIGTSLLPWHQPSKNKKKTRHMIINTVKETATGKCLQYTGASNCTLNYLIPSQYWSFHAVVCFYGQTYLDDHGWVGVATGRVWCGWEQGRSLTNTSTGILSVTSDFTKYHWAVCICKPTSLIIHLKGKNGPTVNISTSKWKTNIRKGQNNNNNNN